MGQDGSKPRGPRRARSFSQAHSLNDRRSPSNSDVSSVPAYVPSSLSLDQLRRLTLLTSDPADVSQRQSDSVANGGSIAPGHVVHVVSQQDKSHSLDLATERLQKLPRVLPVIPASVDSYLFDYSAMSFTRPNSTIDFSASLRLCKAYCKQLRETAIATARRQGMLQEQIRVTERKAFGAVEVLSHHERSLTIVAAHMREVETIGKALSRARSQAYRTMEALQFINASLPEKLRLQEFQWHVVPVDVSEESRAKIGGEWTRE